MPFSYLDYTEPEAWGHVGPWSLEEEKMHFSPTQKRGGIMSNKRTRKGRKFCEVGENATTLSCDIMWLCIEPRNRARAT